MKGRKVMTKFVGLRGKTYSYLMDDSSADKKTKEAKMCVIKKPNFENYKSCLEATHLRIKQTIKKKLMQTV